VDRDIPKRILVQGWDQCITGTNCCLIVYLLYVLFVLLNVIVSGHACFWSCNGAINLVLLPVGFDHLLEDQQERILIKALSRSDPISFLIAETLQEDRRKGINL
jgi:hypothetical protein